jgi:hypothetical protein
MDDQIVRAELDCALDLFAEGGDGLFENAGVGRGEVD